MTYPTREEAKRARRQSSAAYQRARRARWTRLLLRFKTFKGCARCGYREHADALEFHHRDPAPGDLPISRLASSASRRRMKCELAKCDVLCSNCHAIQSNADRRLMAHG